MEKYKNKIDKYISIILTVCFFHINNAYSLEYFTNLEKTISWVDYAGTIKINNKNTAFGDEIAVFVFNQQNEEILVGASQIGTTSQDYYLIHVFEDDLLTVNKDGAYKNDLLMFKYWQKNTNSVFPVLINNMIHVPTNGISSHSIPPVFKSGSMGTIYGMLNINLPEFPTGFVKDTIYIEFYNEYEKLVDKGGNIEIKASNITTNQGYLMIAHNNKSMESINPIGIDQYTHILERTWYFNSDIKIEEESDIEIIMTIPGKLHKADKYALINFDSLNNKQEFNYMKAHSVDFDNNSIKFQVALNWIKSGYYTLAMNNKIEGDMNNDGIINLIDVIKVLNHLVK